MFKVGDIINNLSESVIKSSFWGSPIKVSLLIIFVIIVIVVFCTYGNIEIRDGVSTATMSIKLLILSFFSVMGIVMLSFHNIEVSAEDKYSSNKDVKTAELVTTSVGGMVKPREY